MIFLFLRNVSATIIPSLALPMSIVGTFAVMYLLGYSLDNLSLMALTLSVGFVVDDAIVMLENIVRHMEMGKSRWRRRSTGSREIGFTIVSMTLSLAAVFIPVLFMGGIVGRLFHEFAVTIGVGDPVSGFVSLTLTPMLCSRFLRPPAQRAPRPALPRDRSASSTACCALYERTLRWRAAPPPRTMVVLARDRWSRTVWLFAMMPEGLPPERGHRPDLRASPRPRRASRSTRWCEHQQAVAAIVRQRPERRRVHVSASARAASASAPTRAACSCALKPRDRAQPTADEVIQELRPQAARRSRASASSCRTRRRSASAAS